MKIQIINYENNLGTKTNLRGNNGKQKYERTQKTQPIEG